GNTLNENASINYQDLLLSRQLVQDYQEIIASERVMTLAVKLLGEYQFSQEQLKSMVNVTQKNESSVIAIRAIADEAKVAADISNAVTNAFISQLREMINGNIVGVLNEARIPQFPITNDATKKIIIGIIAGVVVAVCIIYIGELFDLKIRYVEDVENSLKIKVIGVIPKYSIS
ncbi:MAG: YveK family protein, partial [Ruminiclostridium sp.]